MRTFTVFAAALLTAVAFDLCAAENAATLKRAKLNIPAGMTPKDYIVNKKHGGYVTKPNSGFGRVQFVLSQDKVALADLLVVKSKIQRELPVEISFVTNQAKAEITIEIVNLGGVRALSIYPDDSFGVIDVSALSKDNPTKETLASRTRKEMIRAFCYLAGITGGGTAGNIFDVMSGLDRLDSAKEAVPLDLAPRCKNYISRCGLRPYIRETYRTACEQGWAPVPTNDVQKAIWAKVHAMPTTPITIKPETKKVAE